MGFIIEVGKKISLKVDKESSEIDYIFKNFCSSFLMNVKLSDNQSEVFKWYFGDKIGSINAIVGNNGTGKSTIINSIFEKYKEDNKSVVLIENDVIHTNEMSYVPNITITDIRLLVERTHFKESIKEDFLEFKSDSTRKELWDDILWDSAFFDQVEINPFYLEFNEYDNPQNLKEKIIANKMKYVGVPSVDKKVDNKNIEKRELLTEYFEFKQLQVNFSAGELSLMKLYHSIYKSIKNCKEDKVLLLFDEPDMHFHPEWSRRFLYSLTTFLNEIDQKLEFDIIIATHSPFIISDLPSSNVVYLARNKDKKISVIQQEGKLMGEELNTLFVDKFFLKDGRGELFSENYIRLIREMLGVEQYSEDLLNKVKFMAENIDNTVMLNTLEGVKGARYGMSKKI